MHELLQKLLDQRARAWESMKGFLERANDEEKEWTAEDKQEFERMNSELGEFDERIGQLKERIEREANAEEARRLVEGVVRPENEREQTETQDQLAEAWFRSGEKGSYDLSLRGLTVERGLSEARWRVRDITLERSLTVGTASAGGSTVPTSFRRQLYEHLIQNSAIRNTRAEVITTSSGEALILPKTTAHTQGGTIVAEGAGLGASDPTFGQGTLNAYKYGPLIQVSTELLQDTAVDLLGYLARSFGQALANGSGAHFVTGTGSSQPQGVITAGSAMVTGATGLSGVPTADNLIDLFYKVIEPYARQGEWFMRRATVGSIRKLKSTTNEYLWQPALTAGDPDTFLGRPIIQDPNVPATGTSATSVAFGDFSTYKIRDVGNLRFERSDEFAFDHDLVTFRALLRTDGRLLDTTGAIGVFVGGTA